MQMQAVQSSQINAIGYNAATLKMRIEFKPGSLYEYSNVPPDLFEKFAKAESTGSFFYKNIKPFPDKYPYTKLVDAHGKPVDSGQQTSGGAQAEAVVKPQEPDPLPDPVPTPPGG